MQPIKLATALTLITLSLSACTQHGGGFNKQMAGTLAGGAAGAVAATNIGKGRGNIAAIAIGTLLGAAIGGEIGKSLDKADQRYLNNTAQASFEHAPTGVTSQWNNPDSGHSGTFTPTRTYQYGGGYCREYTQTIYVGGRTQEGYGNACRQPDGSWKFDS